MVLPMLTTKDNPYDPFTQYDEWYRYDEDQGYCTCGLLARYTISSDEISETDQELAIIRAIDEIISDDPFDLFRKVSKE